MQGIGYCYEAVQSPGMCESIYRYVWLQQDGLRELLECRRWDVPVTEAEENGFMYFFPHLYTRWYEEGVVRRFPRSVD